LLTHIHVLFVLTFIVSLDAITSYIGYRMGLEEQRFLEKHSMPWPFMWAICLLILYMLYCTYYTLRILMGEHLPGELSIIAVAIFTTTNNIINILRVRRKRGKSIELKFNTVTMF